MKLPCECNKGQRPFFLLMLVLIYFFFFFLSSEHQNLEEICFIYTGGAGE